jgi:signal transduction histidine kinase/predicted CoA-binding protein
MFDFLKKVPLFANLPDDDLNRLCEVVSEESYPANHILFTEGEEGDKAYVIMSGEIDILKESGGRTVLLSTRRSGDVIGEMSLLDQVPRSATGRTRTDCKLLSIHHEDLDHLLDTSPSATRVMLSTITYRLRSNEIILRQSEKMAQLGTLTAGIAHELNNPAAASRRGSEHLGSAIESLQQIYQQFHTLGFTTDQWKKSSELHDFARAQAIQLLDLNSLERSDREEQIETWLERNQVQNSWEYASVLVNLGYQEADLIALKRDFPGRQLTVIVQWLTALFNIFSLLEEINQGTSRIGEIVKSLKSYVYLDQAPVQSVDIHEGLEDTLVILRNKLKKGIEVERHYAQNLPKIQAYGSELNQVWTNIIDNAIDAMDGQGTLRISTRQHDGWVFVEIEDSGPGIPPEIQEKLFSPFFTTKPLGKGTGLGLNISFNIIQKHKGEIKVFSQPGKTCFSVRLPVNMDEAERGMKPLPAVDPVSDDQLRGIFDTTQTIAVVGITPRENAPAYSVPKYLQDKGYTILPINPNYEQILGLKVYPSLLALENTPDMVLVFRRSEFVPEILDQAIEIGAKVVWLQEGIINLVAAERAREAGLTFVMDACMRKNHQRLMGSD